MAVIEEELAALGEEREFWPYQARSLAVFATPQSTRTFRLANRLVAMVEVSDRFHVPLILAAGEPLVSVFRSVNSYPHLVAATIPGNPETTSEADLAAQARLVLDEIARRVWLNGGRVLAVRADDLPSATHVAALLRYAPFGA